MGMEKTFKRAVQDLVIAAQEAAWSETKPREVRVRYEQDLVDARRLVLLKYEQLQERVVTTSPYCNKEWTINGVVHKCYREHGHSGLCVCGDCAESTHEKGV